MRGAAVFVDVHAAFDAVEDLELSFVLFLHLAPVVLTLLVEWAFVPAVAQEGVVAGQRGCAVNERFAVVIVNVAAAM